jgi:hypothetical protein
MAGLLGIVTMLAIAAPLAGKRSAIRIVSALRTFGLQVAVANQV